MSIDSGSQFLKQKYNLHNAPEVERAVLRTETLSDQDVSDDPDARIKNYLLRFAEITDREDPVHRQHGLNALKRLLYFRFVIKPENIPDSLWQAHTEQAQQMGEDNVEITQDIKDRETKRVIADQKESLDRWLDYLASPDAHYPDYLKYFTIRSVLGMGNYDATRHTYTPRSPHTVKRFVTLSRGALARTLDSIERYYGERYFALKRQLEAAQEDVKRAKNALGYAQKLKQTDISPQLTALSEAKRNVAEITAKFEDLINGQAEENADQPQFNKALLSADFAKLYTLALEKSGTAKQELWPVTDGQWVTYEQGQADALVAALDGKGTDWCLEGTATSKTYLDRGNLLVYFSEDEQGQPTVPRAGIWLVDGKVAESHGVDVDQNLDPYIADVVRDKAVELGDPNFEKRAYGMQMLSYLGDKVEAGHELNKDDLVFLYEINSPIEGFGYGRHPRIEKLRALRDPEKDTPIVFECQPEEIAHRPDEINESTKAYIGPLVDENKQPIKDIFLRLNDIKHIYTAFPEGRIKRDNLTIGYDPDQLPAELKGRTKEQIQEALKKSWIAKLDGTTINGIKSNVSNYAKDMIRSTDFTFQENIERIDLVRLKVSDLGFARNPTTNELYAKAAEFGLELCPAEVGPYQRLQDANQPFNEWYFIAMKQIADRRGLPGAFSLGRDADGLWLGSRWADPARRWGLGGRLVFRVRKVFSEPSSLNNFE